MRSNQPPLLLKSARPVHSQCADVTTAARKKPSSPRRKFPDLGKAHNRRTMCGRTNRLLWEMGGKECPDEQYGRGATVALMAGSLLRKRKKKGPIRIGRKKDVTMENVWLVRARVENKVVEIILKKIRMTK